MQSYSFSFYTSSIKSKNHVSEVITIDTFLHWIRDGKYSKQVNAARTAKGDRQEQLKNELPYCTISGVFVPGKRDAQSLQQHSGLIQIDIDSKGQTSFDPVQTKELLKSDDYILSAFLSPRGTGLKAVVKIDPNKHKDSFYGLEKYFKTKYSIVIDPSCKDVCRPFFISFDKDVFTNPNSKVFPVPELDGRINPISMPGSFLSDRGKKIDDIEVLCAELETRRIDITNRNGYSEWRDIGFAIANGLGEEGRSYFKRISSIAHNYDDADAEDQYTACNKNPDGGRKWESLFGIAKDYNIIINNNSRHRNIHKEAVHKPLNHEKKTQVVENKNLPLIVQVETF